MKGLIAYGDERLVLQRQASALVKGFVELVQAAVDKRSAPSNANVMTQTKMSQGYDLDVPGLATAVSNCPPESAHQALIKCVRAFEATAEAKLATTRGVDGSHDAVRRKVLANDGTLVHDDHEAWVKEQLLSDTGDAGKTYSRLRDANYLLSKCEITRLYLVHDKGTDNPADFVQVTIRQEDEFVDALAFERYTWEMPKTLRGLLYLVEGETLPTEARRRIGHPVYQLEAVINVEAFVAEAEAVDARLREKVRQRTYRVSGSNASPDSAQASEIKTHDENSPGWIHQSHKARRLFNDWKSSSPGLSGARLCDHWVMQLFDCTDPKSTDRHLDLVPMWTFPEKLAEVDSSTGDTHTHFGKLQTLDRRVKVPFGWYFYMLHGDRVGDGSGKRVLEDAEAGLIVLAEHDYRVLKAWQENEYGF
ncbi:MAG: hypothetical protein BGO35_16295 [Burkholderiales bacterium 64-34]|nr:MAG: hypothetical protein BGO35_16295 [Burkholderiales bacterium 64-34]